MHRHGVVVVQLYLRRHLLFNHEYLMADRIGVFAQAVPGPQGNTHR